MRRILLHIDIILLIPEGHLSLSVRANRNTLETWDNLRRLFGFGGIRLRDLVLFCCMSCLFSEILTGSRSYEATRHLGLFCALVCHGV